MARGQEQNLTAFNLAIVFSLCLGSLSYGYSFSIVSTTLGQPSWYTYFDLSQDPTNPRYDFTNSILGTINGVFSAGGCFGALFVAWACDRLGRRSSILLAGPVAVVGGALQGGAAHIAMFLVGRLLSGFAVGMLVVLVPLFQSEVAPPATRGFLVAQHGVILVLGYVLAAWIGVACYFSSNPHFQWRFPLCLQSLWPLCMLALVPVIPESPRWLLMNGKPKEAWAVIHKLHHSGKVDGGGGGGCGEVRSHFAREEFYQIFRQVEVDLSLASQETVWTLFTKPSYRRRMICAFLTTFGTESTGILVIYNYSVLLYQGLGFSGSTSLILAASYVTVACIGNYINSILVDKVGRVKLFVTGCIGCMVCLSFETALSAEYIGSNHTAGLSAGVFFLFAYVAFYGSCLDANTFVYCSEIFPTHIRSRGVAFSISILFLSTIAYLTPAPTAFGNIGWRYYLVFIVLTAICTPCMWYLFPETKGLSLEEIGEKFGDEVVVHLDEVTDEQIAQLDEITSFKASDLVQEKPAASTVETV
ncbi:hypothetical protein CLAIMM_01981 [Cladophialophora immunda]|nr:hypothetical protein CLAIMM_01981 [Cladophialophora immunda]